MVLRSRVSNIVMGIGGPNTRGLLEVSKKEEELGTNRLTIIHNNVHNTCIRKINCTIFLMHSISWPRWWWWWLLALHHVVRFYGSAVFPREDCERHQREEKYNEMTIREGLKCLLSQILKSYTDKQETADPGLPRYL